MLLQYRIVKFSNVFHLTIHIPRNYGEDSTKVYYIGLRGEFQKVIQVLYKSLTAQLICIKSLSIQTNRDAVLIANYELAPNPAECNTNKLKETNVHQIH